MKKIWEYIVWFLAWFYVLTLLQIFNFFGRARWYAEIICKRKWRDTSAGMQALLTSAHRWAHLVETYKSFQYKFDGLGDFPGVFGKWPTWVPTLRILVYHNIQNNCDGAEILSKKLIREYNNQNPLLKVKYKRRIYVPVNPRHWDKAHFFGTVIHNKTELQFSSGKITEETREALAARYTHGKEVVFL